MIESELKRNILVIGCGNPLRGDDAVGRYVAVAIERRAFPDVEVLEVHQLTPELTERIARADLAIVIDAEVGGLAEVRARSFSPVLESSADSTILDFEPASGPASSHISLLHEMVNLIGSLFDRCPPVWLVTIPVTDLSYRVGLSAAGKDGARTAFRLIHGIISGGAPVPSQVPIQRAKEG